ARLVKRTFISSPACARRVLGRGRALVEADELGPAALASSHVRRVEILRRRRRTHRLPEQGHARLDECSPTLPVIARLARCDDVLPDVLASAMPRHHMIQREVVAALSAVLAGVVVTDEHFLAGHLYDW